MHRLGRHRAMLFYGCPGWEHRKGKMGKSQKAYWKRWGLNGALKVEYDSRWRGEGNINKIGI